MLRPFRLSIYWYLRRQHFPARQCFVIARDHSPSVILTDELYHLLETV
ncbi:hypothetical protein TBK1r_05790 [Stieleria magnilauensis]|uniref:Uncharacterized protein n=1 Tax=Stieleria magnilauensis TaxID=2527963 RepID=A0ABX5XI44_9BACT|nr:hypothetical protein TBK1r_05790 [Planctomycetes bacterium TBK1r]